MSQISTGGSAFPRPHDYHEQDHPGMTLRDYFAAKAMQASISPSTTPDEFDEIARQSYQMADQMLQARKMP